MVVCAKAMFGRLDSAGLASDGGRNFGPSSRMTYDTISVHDLELRGRHGVYEEERSEGRRFAFDVEVDVPAGSLGANDALGRTVDYRDIAGIVVEVVAELRRPRYDRFEFGVFTI